MFSSLWEILHIFLSLIEFYFSGCEVNSSRPPPLESEPTAELGVGASMQGIDAENVQREDQDKLELHREPLFSVLLIDIRTASFSNEGFNVPPCLSDG